MPKTRTVAVTLDGPIFDEFSVFSRLSDKERDRLFRGMADFIDKYMREADLVSMVGSMPKPRIPVMFEKHKINEYNGSAWNEEPIVDSDILNDIDMMEIFDDSDIS